MSSVLVRYGTGEGQTAKVTDRITEELVAHSHGATAVNVKDADRDLDLGEPAEAR